MIAQKHSLQYFPSLKYLLINIIMLKSRYKENLITNFGKKKKKTTDSDSPCNTLIGWSNIFSFVYIWKEYRRNRNCLMKPLQTTVSPVQATNENWFRKQINNNQSLVVPRGHNKSSHSRIYITIFQGFVWRILLLRRFTSFNNADNHKSKNWPASSRHRWSLSKLPHPSVDLHCTDMHRDSSATLGSGD